VNSSFSPGDEATLDIEYITMIGSGIPTLALLMPGQVFDPYDWAIEVLQTDNYLPPGEARVALWGWCEKLFVPYLNFSMWSKAVEGPALRSPRDLQCCALTHLAACSSPPAAGPYVWSISYGASEQIACYFAGYGSTCDSTQYVLAANGLLMAMASLGVSILVASGDAGASNGFNTCPIVSALRDIRGGIKVLSLGPAFLESFRCLSGAYHPAWLSRILLSHKLASPHAPPTPSGITHAPSSRCPRPQNPNYPVVINPSTGTVYTCPFSSCGCATFVLEFPGGSCILPTGANVPSLAPGGGCYNLPLVS
jgi:hypothetical protein